MGSSIGESILFSPQIFKSYKRCGGSLNEDGILIPSASDLGLSSLDNWYKK